MKETDNKMKITHRRLRRIIREAIDILNTETGELLIFDDAGEVSADGQPIVADAPEAAARDIMKRLNITELPSEWDREDGVETIEVAADDWALIDAELRGKRHVRKAKKERQRMDISRLLARADQWAKDAGGDYEADNPGVDMEGVARDLAASAKYEFEQDEWEELIWHFDEDGAGEEDLINFIADRIAG